MKKIVFIVLFCILFLQDDSFFPPSPVAVFEYPFVTQKITVAGDTLLPFTVQFAAKSDDSLDVDYEIGFRTQAKKIQVGGNFPMNLILDYYGYHLGYRREGRNIFLLVGDKSLFLIPYPKKFLMDNLYIVVRKE
ncbi:hypothetical protein K9M59_01790 [Candidatus Gracilibacteria bacterium]|nr:hypothetical protein [Candidatus Gracilibacteria bacterium]MCF7819735.1 hypothetical protein [Candidatus Gracilibacteria bacterium]